MSTQTNQETMDVDANLSQEQQDLLEAKEILEKLNGYAKEAQTLATESLKNGTSVTDQEQLVEIAMVKWKRYHEVMKSTSQRFPFDSEFAVNDAATPMVPKPTEARLPSPRKSDMPFLVVTKEKTRHPKELVFENVKDFIDAFEDIMVLYKLNVDIEYKRFLPVAISKAYRGFIDAQRATSTSTETWTMVKDWLVQFTNTPNNNDNKRGFNDSSNNVKRRRFDSNDNNNSNNRPSKYGGPTGPVDGGRGVYCGYGCGEIYMKGHVCRQWPTKRTATARKVNVVADVMSTYPVRAQKEDQPSYEIAEPILLHGLLTEGLP
ncbi:unnamed protein product [Absidia cylindrospora]